MMLFIKTREPEAQQHTLRLVWSKALLACAMMLVGFQTFGQAQPGNLPSTAVALPLQDAASLGSGVEGAGAGLAAAVAQMGAAQGVRGAVLSPMGGWVSFIRSSSSDANLSELWLQPLPAGAPRRILSPLDLPGMKEPSLAEAEKQARDPYRAKDAGVLSARWCGRGDRRLLVTLADEIFLLEWQEEALDVVRIARAEGLGRKADAQCDAEGRTVAFVQQGDLWVRDVQAAAPRRLTTQATATRTLGWLDAQTRDQWGQNPGFWWAPEGRRLLALEVDESRLPALSRPAAYHERGGTVAQRYPLPGGALPAVRPVVVEAQTGAVLKLNLPADVDFIPRAGWLADGSVWLMGLSRDQKKLSLVVYEPRSPKPVVVFEERDEAWIEPHDDLLELPAMPLSGKPALLWSSEKDGMRQLYALDRVRSELRQLTQMPEPVGHVVCAEGPRVVFAGATQQGRGQELFELDLGEGASRLSIEARTRMLDSGKPERWRAASRQEACRQVLVSQSAWGVRPVHLVLAPTGGAPSGPLDAGSALPAMSERIPVAAEPVALALPGRTDAPPDMQPLDFKTSDGAHALHAFYLPPHPPKTLVPSGAPSGMAAPPALHPVIVKTEVTRQEQGAVYRWHPDTPLLQYWQRLGFGVVLFGTRGTSGRSRAFSRSVALAPAATELQDVFALVRQLPQRVTGADESRMALVGTGYAGHLAVRAMLDPESPLAVAFAASTWFDWSQHQSAFAERMLGIPEAGRTGAYAEWSLLPLARKLDKPLMIMHGMADAQTPYAGAQAFVTAVQNAGKLVETAVYPGVSQPLADPRMRLQALRTQTDFLLRRLRLNPAAALCVP
jgi:dipeptidyl-peptidase-4